MVTRAPSPQLDDSNADRLRRPRCSSVDEKNLHPKYLNYIRLQSLYLQAHRYYIRLYCPSSNHNTLPSSISGAHKDIELAHSAHQSKIDLWGEKEAEAEDKREGSNTDGTKTRLVHSTKKKCRTDAGDEPPSKRRIKRHRDPLLQMKN
ncbi:hypothetical protein N7G274_005178 [Stereocaulon virgatum]|uniref:Uncharacterized protein n=1 Tax=Stereocaulon virgatum TaxID=373712 RepID=A0ABR4A860_9LECA